MTLKFENGDSIETTPEHPFYVQGKGWIQAGELGIGTSIITRAGPTRVLSRSIDDENKTVYNFEVEGTHSYFVGQNALWVHNYDYSDLIGVPEPSFNRMMSRLENLRIGDKKIVSSIDAFGSRAGSTYKGRGPLAHSDLDILVNIDPTVLSGRSNRWVRKTLRNISDDFEAEVGYKISLHAPDNMDIFLRSIPGTKFKPLMR